MCPAAVAVRATGPLVSTKEPSPAVVAVTPSPEMVAPASGLPRSSSTTPRTSAIAGAPAAPPPEPPLPLPPAPAGRGATVAGALGTRGVSPEVPGGRPTGETGVVPASSAASSAKRKLPPGIGWQAESSAEVSRRPVSRRDMGTGSYCCMR
ncbi:hypothetical protein D3C72_491510 [compost metagenome]